MVRVGKYLYHSIHILLDHTGELCDYVYMLMLILMLTFAQNVEHKTRRFVRQIMASVFNGLSVFGVG
jgi:hypothetical protein